jgi:hypothetical protein
MTENIKTKLERRVMLQNVLIWLRIGSSGRGGGALVNVAMNFRLQHNAGNPLINRNN